MANYRYDKFADALLTTGGINLLTDEIRVALVKNTYGQSLTTDQFASSIQSYIVGTPQTLTTKTVSGGVFDADDVTVPDGASGETIEAVVMYKWTGDFATSPLICYFDNIQGFPFTTSGASTTVRWNSGSTKIFRM